MWIIIVAVLLGLTLLAIASPLVRTLLMLPIKALQVLGFLLSAPFLIFTLSGGGLFALFLLWMVGTEPGNNFFFNTFGYWGAWIIVTIADLLTFDISSPKPAPKPEPEPSEPWFDKSRIIGALWVGGTLVLAILSTLATNLLAWWLVSEEGDERRQDVTGWETGRKAMVRIFLGFAPLILWAIWWFWELLVTIRRFIRGEELVEDPSDGSSIDTFASFLGMMAEPIVGIILAVCLAVFWIFRHQSIQTDVLQLREEYIADELQAQKNASERTNERLAKDAAEKRLNEQLPYPSNWWFRLILPIFAFFGTMNYFFDRVWYEYPQWGLGVILVLTMLRMRKTGRLCGFRFLNRDRE